MDIDFIFSLIYKKLTMLIDNGKGYVFNLNSNYFDMKRIQSLIESDYKYNPFSYVIELQLSDENSKFIQSNTKLKLMTVENEEG